MTNWIADSPSPNITIAGGNHAIDGIVCKPVIIEPMAARSTLLRATSAPTVVPMIRANA